MCNIMSKPHIILPTRNSFFISTAKKIENKHEHKIKFWVTVSLQLLLIYKLYANIL